MSKTNLYILFTIVMTLLLSVGVSAYENYQLTAPFSPVTVASCSSGTEILALKNAGDEVAQITLTFVDKDVNEFAQIQPSTLFLTPGETKTLTIFINAPCTTQGTFDYAIQAQGNSISQIFDRQIAINKISNVDFIATKGNVLNSCPCIPQTIPFTITNTGSWAESYEVSAIGEEENVAVPQGKLFLAPGQTFSGAAFVSYSCQTYGVKDFALQVEATNSQFKATMPVTYNIAACYDYTLGLDRNVTVCEQDVKEAIAVVNNTAAYTNTFDLDSSIPTFAQLQGNQVTLAAAQIGIAPLTFAPNRGDAGQYAYTISSVSRLGKLTALQTGQLNVQRCYEYNIATPADQTKYAVCAPGEQLTFTITNNGELTQEMHVNSTDARFTSTPSLFNLTSGASKNITLSVPSKGIEHKMSFELQVWATNNKNVVATKRITLQPYDLRTCFGVEVAPDAFVLNNSPRDLSIKVTNQGIRGAVYNLTVAGPQWAKLLNDTVYIAAKSSEYITLRANAPVFIENATYIANLSFETTYTQQVDDLNLILNPQTGKWLLWFMLILLLLLIALLVVLLAARRSRNSLGQPSKIQVKKAPPVVVAKETTPKVKKLTAAQKRELRNAKRRAKNDSGISSWGRLLFIILFVAILLSLLLALILKDSARNGELFTQQNNTLANASNVSISGSVGIESNVTSNITAVIPVLNQTLNLTVSNVTPLTNASPFTNESWTNDTNINTSSSSVIDEKQAQRNRDLSAAYAIIAQSQAEKSNRVFALAQNTSGKLNLSQYFVDLDNLTLSFEFQSVNASKITAFINNNILFLEPNTNFVGVQTFRIIATNEANLSTTSPLFTVAILDEIKDQSLSKSVQLGLLILLIVIALIVYFDIRLIAKQYERARLAQNDKNKK